MSVDTFDTGFDKHKRSVLCDGFSGSNNSISGVQSQELCIACREEEEKARRIDVFYRRYPGCSCFFRRSPEEGRVECHPPPPHLCIAPGSCASRSGPWCRRLPDESSSDFETVQAPPATICAGEELQWWANRKEVLSTEVVGVRVDRTARGAPPSQPLRPWYILGCCGVRLGSLERCRPEPHPTVPSLPLQPPPTMVTKKMALKSWKDGQRALRGQVLVGRKTLAFVVGGFLGLFALTAGLMVGIVLASSKVSSSWTATRHIDNPEDRRLLSAAIAVEGRERIPHLSKSLDFVTVTPSSEMKRLDGSSGWGHFPKGSVNGSRYVVINRPFTFHAAQEICLKLGGYLAHVNSLREQLYLEDFLGQEMQRSEPGNSPDSEDAIGYWIGAKRARGSHDGTCMYDQWKWIDGYGRTLGVIAGQTAFVPGKPDNYYDPEECLYMSYKDGLDDSRFLKWDDAPCDLNSLGNIRALCEVETR